jgi:scyllo-inositol 2-dehydrogenase (NADP+)
MIRTGVIGYGLGGMAFHAPLVDAVPELELVAIATSRGGEVHARYPQVRVSSPEALIGDPDIALVVISTPNDSHYPLARAALEAGKHVVIDKPFTNHVVEGEALVSLAARKRLVLSAFHNRRWDADFLTVKKLLAGGRLGEVMLAELRWDRFRPEVTTAWRDVPEAGSGILADLGPHLLDQALQLFGMPEALTADIAVQRDDARTDDYYEITLHYGQRRVIVSSSRLVIAARPRFALHGKAGNFVKYGLDPQEPWMRAGRSAAEAGYGVEDPAQYGMLTLADGTREAVPSEVGDYRRYYSGIGQAIASGAAAPVTAEDAVTGLRLIELARESAREGKRLTL